MYLFYGYSVPMLYLTQEICGTMRLYYLPEFNRHLTKNNHRLQVTQSCPGPHRKRHENVYSTPSANKVKYRYQHTWAPLCLPPCHKSKVSYLSYRAQESQTCGRNAKRALRVQQHTTGPFFCNGGQGGCPGGQPLCLDQLHGCRHPGPRHQAVSKPTMLCMSRSCSTARRTLVEGLGRTVSGFRAGRGD